MKKGKKNEERKREKKKRKKEGKCAGAVIDWHPIQGVFQLHG